MTSKIAKPPKDVKRTSTGTGLTVKKPEITIIHNGPCHLCEYCWALLHVPEELTKEEEVKETDPDNGDTYLVIRSSFVCPQCDETTVFQEDELDEEPKPSDKKKKH